METSKTENSRKSTDPKSMPNRSKLKVILPSDLEITLVRDFRAPIHLVFETQSKEDHVKRWYGPHDTTVPECEIDLRIGGAYRFVCRAADGNDAVFKGIFQEIDPPRKLVYTEIYEPYEEVAPPALVTVTLTEANGVTTLTSNSVYPSKEIRDMVIQSGMEGGAAQSYDRMEDLLHTMCNP